ncbi:MAG: hypothetical protein BWY44_01380 [Candidatus Omnitrophica bacterium ADurb.Bin292]|nr:MAG: hypothetical protein BWY44_01380 [Candidatus Omnitrophica bacterium ADurb.Bin292]
MALKPPLLKKQEDIHPENVFERVKHHRFDRIKKISEVSPRFHDALENLRVVKIHPGILETPRRNILFRGNKIRRAVHQTGLEQIIFIRCVRFRVFEYVQPPGHRCSRGTLNQNEIQLFPVPEPGEDAGDILLGFPRSMGIFDVKKKNRLISG